MSREKQLVNDNDAVVDVGAGSTEGSENVEEVAESSCEMWLINAEGRKKCNRGDNKLR